MAQTLCPRETAMHGLVNSGGLIAKDEPGQGAANSQPLRLWTARRAQPSGVMANIGNLTFSPQLRARFDTAQLAFWLRWQPLASPGSNEEMLHNLINAYDFLTHTGGEARQQERVYTIQYLILASDRQGVFHHGCDLELFLRLIASGDRHGLRYYGLICAELNYRTYIACGLPLTTIALVQGACLGGGFETALACDLIVAEESAQFGFPEIRYGLFPGMGAYAFLRRRVGRQKTEELLTDGRRYTAREMAEIGLVDYVTADGAGAMEVDQLIRARSRNHTALHGISTARRAVERLELAELHAVVDAWVDCALQLTERDKQTMRQLIERQNDLLFLSP